MKTTMPIFLAGCAAVALAMNQSSYAIAESADGSSETATLSEVVVTATRTGVTDLQETPIAVTAFSAEDLVDRGITNVLDLNGMAPNVSIGSRSGAGATGGMVSIRGIGVDANPPAQPGVGIYVDEVYIPAQFGNLLGTYDLAEVEILRGPQGTLFGRNTIGGALQYTSVKPQVDQVNGFLEGTAGNMHQWDIAGGINIPLTSWAAVRISGADTNIDGYVHDLLNDVNRGSERNRDGRVQLRIQPLTDLTIDLKVEDLKQSSNGPAATQLGFEPGLFYTPALLAYISPNAYTTYGTNQANYFNSDLKIGQGKVEYEITDHLKIRSITAYSYNQDDLVLDEDGTPLSIFATNRGTDRNKLFTQELQLAGDPFASTLHYAVGLYYYHEDTSNTGSCSSIFGSPCLNQDFGDYKVITKSYAAYGQATYNFTEQWSLLGGLRYTDDDEAIGDPQSLYKTGGASDNNWSPLIGVNYELSKDTLYYVKWSRGFRGGGFYPNIYSPDNFQPETAETAEVGARFEFYDHRFRVNPTLFTTNWKNIQFNSLAIYFPPLAPTVTPIPTVQNAGRAIARGAELESQFAVTRQFTATFNGAYFDGHYTSVLPNIDVTDATRLSHAPMWSAALGGRYTVPVGDGQLTLNANYEWQDRQRSAVSNADNLEIAAYGLLNARLSYTSPYHYVISLFGNNLTDKNYAIGGVNFGNGGVIPTIERDVGRPREYGITVRYNYH